MASGLFRPKPLITIAILVFPPVSIDAVDACPLCSEPEFDVLPDLDFFLVSDEEF